MTSKTDFIKFIQATTAINAMGADYTRCDIPYDPECPIKKGTKIIKTAEDSPGRDSHPLGATGITIGGLMIPPTNEFRGDGYLILWDNSPHKVINGHITFTTGEKIKEV